jgi:TolB protein
VPPTASPRSPTTPGNSPSPVRPGVKFTRIFIANGDGSGERALTNGFAADNEPSFAPGGHRIVFVRGPGNSKLVSIKADGTDAVYLTKDTDPFELPTSPSYSPDHKRILFNAVEAGSNRIYTIDADDGSGPKQLTDLDPREGDNVHLSWGG